MGQGLRGIENSGCPQEGTMEAPEEALSEPGDGLRHKEHSCAPRTLEFGALQEASRPPGPLRGAELSLALASALRPSPASALPCPPLDSHIRV